MHDQLLPEPSIDAASEPRPGPLAQQPRRVDSRRLLAGAHEVVIDHAGQAYRLRLTRNDKLILTK